MRLVIQSFFASTKLVVLVLEQNFICTLCHIAIYYYCAVLRKMSLQHVTGIFAESAMSDLSDLKSVWLD